MQSHQPTRQKIDADPPVVGGSPSPGRGRTPHGVPAPFNPLSIALAYAAKGIAVFPLKEGTKIPAFEGYMDAATTDRAQIEAWFTGARYNVGAQLQKSGLLVVDYDSQAAFDRFGALAEGAVVVATPKGYHAYFKRGDARVTRAVRALADVDVLSNGYVVCAGSQVDGKIYRTIRRGDLRPTPAEVVALLERSKPSKTPTLSGSAASGQTIGEGGRNQALFKLASTLRAQGLSAEAIEASLMVTNQQQCVPPLEAHEVATIARQAGKYEGRDVIADTALAAIAAKHAKKAKAMPSALAGENPAGKSVARRIGLAIAEPKAPVETYSTGIDSLDEKLFGGIATGALTVVTGSPGGGKTAWLLDFCLRHEAARPILLVSAELDKDAVASRLVANRLGLVYTLLDRGQIKNACVAVDSADPRLSDGATKLAIAHTGGKLDPNTADATSRDSDPYSTPSGVPELKAKVLSDTRIWIIDEESIPRTAEEITDSIIEAMNMIEEETGQWPLLGVDYLQLLARSDGDDPRLAVNTLTDKLRHLAKIGQGTAVVALNSVGRGFYGSGKAALRQSTDPTDFLSSAKESGNVEYDASTVLFFDDMPDGTAWTPVRIAIPKARGGARGFAYARHNKPCGRWQSGSEADWQVEETTAAVKRIAKANAQPVEGKVISDGIDRLQTALTGQGWTAAELAVSIGADLKSVQPALDDWVRREVLVVELEGIDGTRLRKPRYRKKRPQ